MTVRVLVADDQPLVRAGLAGIIGTAPDLTVVGEAGTGREAVERTWQHRPDVVLMDVRMPDLDGIEATRRITRTAAHPADPKVLVLTTFDLDEYVYGALRAGASGFLLKDAPPADLIHAVRTVAAGDALIAPGITKRLIARFAAESTVDTPPATTTTPAITNTPSFQRVLDRVTDREREVLLLVAEGLSNPEIAARLHITPGTAKTHVAHLLTKLDARDRVQLVILAHRAGLA